MILLQNEFKNGKGVMILRGKKGKGKERKKDSHVDHFVKFEVYIVN